jgi:copper(I)-binding protein
VTEPDTATHVRRRQPITRRGLQVALGVLWVLDGALQLQPFMLGSGFASQVLAPAGAGQPGWVAAGVHWAASLVGTHPTVWDALFAIAQLAIGAGLLWRPLARVALVASVVWSAAVWYFGEGLGGLASGRASLVTGAPGAVLLYAVLAFVVWPARDPDSPPGWRGWARHDSSGPPAAWTPVAWAVVWVGGAVLQALPGQNTADDLADALTGNMPAWQMGLNNAIADHVRWTGVEDNWLLLGVLVAIGLCGLGGPRLRTAAGWSGGVLATLFWVVGQGFGNLFSGQATDPNSGPLLVLLSLALLGTAPVLVPAGELDRVPAWWLSARTSAMSGITALVVVGVALLQWGTTQPAPPAPKPALAVSAVYTPVGATAKAPVYFTLTNTGAGADTLVAAGTEFQTKTMASGISVCPNVVCAGNTVTIPAHSTLTFGPAGPHLSVSGLGALTKAHQPLQVTLTFARSGVVHVLSPVGTPADLTQNDVMTYAYMGHQDPGMDMGGMDMGPGSSPGTSTTPMPGMTMPGG